MDPSSPAWFKFKHRSSSWLSRKQERTSLRKARVLIANSERTRSDLVNYLQIDSERIYTVYPGADADFSQSTPARRAAARAWLGKDEHKPLVVFAGALGRDSNKGLDVLLSAWQRLCARADWDGDLIVAGFGRAKDFWKRQIVESHLEGRVFVLGFTDRMPDLLAAVDLLVSPVRYESYGLSVHEAICCGIPAMVTETAGVAERYPSEVRELLISDPENVESLAAMILRWRGALGYWKEKVAPFSQVLRRNTLEVMAHEFVAIAEGIRQARADPPIST
jgi:glycosyltransferase involved in cell wall biosynthesis